MASFFICMPLVAKSEFVCYVDWLSYFLFGGLPLNSLLIFKWIVYLFPFVRKTNPLFIYRVFHHRKLTHSTDTNLLPLIMPSGIKDIFHEES